MERAVVLKNGTRINTRYIDSYQPHGRDICAVKKEWMNRYWVDLRTHGCEHVQQIFKTPEDRDSFLRILDDAFGIILQPKIESYDKDDEVK
jgi:hypothetical protein